MRKTLLAVPLLALPLLSLGPRPAESACCYFAAKDKDILQPAQKAFLTWDAAEKVETFTVQPKFEGNAADFGMVIPTPSKPKLDEMPREFFKELAVFTILEPMDLSKYKQFPRGRFGGAPGALTPVGFDRQGCKGHSFPWRYERRKPRPPDGDVGTSGGTAPIPARGMRRESCRPASPRWWNGAWRARGDVRPSSAARS